MKREGSEAEKERDKVRKAELDFGMSEEIGSSGSAGEAEDAWIGRRRPTKLRLATCKGSDRKREPKSEPPEPRGGRANRGGRVEKDRANQVKAKIKTWEDAVKGLKEDELEIANSDKRRNESEKTDSVEKFDSDEPNYVKAKRT